jgi:DNA-binding MarR family transcriptional regulator/GNAT superfamily N-acetyltransferase
MTNVRHADVSAVREFNRFYTRHLGLLDQAHLDSAFSLAGARVLYELAHWSETHAEPATATALARELELDAGYLSRTLADFQRRRLIKRSTAREDARQSHLTLTAAGRATFADLDARAHRAVADVLAPVSNTPAVISAMRTVLRALDPSTRGEPSDIVLRDPRPGDYGWIVMRHGELYAQEYGWDIRFESLMAHPERRKVAKLRLLLVEPSARGLGVGRTLVDACATFARAAGYDTITLWTNSVLVSARRIYQAAGYRLVDEAPHSMFGSDLVGQTWELKL